MSCNSYGHVIVGLRVSNKKLTERLEELRASQAKEKRGCKHKVEEKAKFCPECGKPRVIVEKPEEIDIDRWVDQLGLSYVTSTDRYDWFFTSDSKWTASTADINCGCTFESITFPTVDDLREIVLGLKTKLEPYGLWNPSEFRIWVVGYCSY